MKEPRKRYQMVYGHPAAFIKLLNEEGLKGWKCVGGVEIDGDRYVQLMTRSWWRYKLARLLKRP